MSKNIAWLKEVPFSHRGLHNDDYPENSLGAFKNSIKYGYGIELDVLLTKDNKVVVFHDYNLERMTNNKSDVNELTYKEISELLLLNTDEKIPLLSEVLKCINGKIPVLIEIKAIDEYISISENVYNITKDYTGIYSIQSFDPRVLKWYKENAPQVVRGQISNYFEDTILKWDKKIILRNMMLNFNTKPDYICYGLYKLNSLRIKSLRKKMPIISWTIKDKEDMKKGYKYSDNIIFEKIMPPINKKVDKM
ncbi:MAG: glycerophosphodiester phosphodiesterase family protein [Peptostreptococcaceae bacterium]